MSPIGIDAAIALVREHAMPQASLRLPLAATVGMHLAQDVSARFPLPRWTAASMDGFAVHGDDLAALQAGNPVRLHLAGATAAGEPEPPPLAHGHTWRVATGGGIPANTDSVIRQEDTTRIDDDVEFSNRRDIGHNVRPIGADIAAGDRVFESGTRIEPGVLAMLAALGVANPMVHRRPRVMIACSGDELADVGATDALLSGRRIADVNTPMLTALVERAGGVAIVMPPVADTLEAVTAAVRAGSDTDLVMTAGAVSVGQHDHVPAAMAALGARQVYRRVALRPGGPTTMAILPDGTPWLALPGNPVSAFVTFALFAATAIRAMLGDGEPEPRWRKFALAQDVHARPRLEQLLRATLQGGEPPRATPTGSQESWVLSSIARAEALIRIPVGVGVVTAGTVVEGISLLASR